MYDITTYIRDYRAFFDTIRFLMLPSAWAVLVVPFESRLRDNAAEAWQKRLKHCGGRGALELQAACQKVVSPFVRCREKDDYQKGLETLLAEVRRRPKVPSVVTIAALELSENLFRLYFISNRAYWS